jgi:OOP family OmpA-OmpF porin
MKKTIGKSILAHTSSPSKIALLTLTLAISQLATAAEPGWYVGGSIGAVEADLDNNGIAARMSAIGLPNSRLDTSSNDTGFKVFGGFQVNNILAVEGGYFDLGEFGYKAFGRPGTVYTADNTLRGVNVDLLGSIALTERVSTFGRFGVTYFKTKDSYRGFGAVIVSPFSDSDRGVGHKYGVGLQYDFNTNVALRLEAERYNFDDAMLRDSNVAMYSLGVVYRFAQPAVAEPVRAPVSAAPAPAPAPTPPAAPVRITLSADTLFTFDSSTVTPAGRAELDTLAADLRGIDYDTIVVTGHADRIGSQPYNLDLSNRRATAVRDYLVSAASIPAARISTRGVNSSEPVTTMAQCSNQLARAQLIACLAPDRRVEVEVTGTRPR